MSKCDFLKLFGFIVLAAKTCLDMRHALIIGYLHIVLSLWKNKLLTIQNNSLHLQISPIDIGYTWLYCQKNGILYKKYETFDMTQKAMNNNGEHWYLRLGISARIWKKNDWLFATHSFNNFWCCIMKGCAFRQKAPSCFYQTWLPLHNCFIKGPKVCPRQKDGLTYFPFFQCLSDIPSQSQFYIQMDYKVPLSLLHIGLKLEW